MKSDVQFLECVQASSLVSITTNVGQYADVILSEEAGCHPCMNVILGTSEISRKGPVQHIERTSTRNGSSDSKYAAQEPLCILHGTRRD
ncbi:hypothetical protein P692DRAFT_20831977, partial [Suillus brevipes Sb2]